MKLFPFVATLGLIAVLAGCDSMSSRVHERFAQVPPHIRVFAAPRKQVFTAAQQAVKDIGLLQGRTSFADGRIEAYAPIRSGDATRDTKQSTLDIRLIETDGGDTEVDLLVWEHSEGGFPGGVSEQALREHSLYEMYFAALQQVLLKNGSIKADQKP